MAREQKGNINTGSDACCMTSFATRFFRRELFRSSPASAVLAGAGLAAMATLMMACSGGLTRGQPPLVGISAVQLDGQQLQARVDIHNPNDVEMEVSRFEMAMVLGDADLGLRSDSPGIKIHPNGTEEIGFNLPVDQAARDNLAQLESGQRSSVAYSISGRVVDSQGESEKFSQQGYFYPVPGRPGQFRGAGPQRNAPRNR